MRVSEPIGQVETCIENPDHNVQEIKKFIMNQQDAWLQEFSSEDCIQGLPRGIHLNLEVVAKRIDFLKRDSFES